MEQTETIYKTASNTQARRGRPFPKLASGSRSKQHNVLKNGILADSQNGNIYLKAPALDLQFPMMVVRHGQTDGNIRRIFQGQIDGPENQLNSVGREQAHQAAKQVYGCLSKLLGPQLKDFAVSGRLRVLSSPLTRAQDTSRAFSEYFERRTGIALKLMLEKSLAEMYFGTIEGLATEQVQDEELREDTMRFREQNAVVNWKGSGESFLDVVYRAKDLLERLNADWAGSDVLAISFAHGTLINALRAAVGDKKLVEDDGLIAFRKDMIDNARPFWLGDSEELAESLRTRVMRGLSMN